MRSQMPCPALREDRCAGEITDRVSFDQRQTIHRDGVQWQVMQRPGSRLSFGGILLTMYDASLELTAEVDRDVRDFFGEVVFQNVIPRDVAVSEAPSHGCSVVEYAPRSRGARAYVELCLEVMDRE